MDLIDVFEGRNSCRAVVNTVMNIIFPYFAGNFFASCEPVSFSRRILLRGVSKVGLAEVDTNYFPERTVSSITHI
jgi:hypothetical protein